jgi:hypothetical protein
MGKKIASQRKERVEWIGESLSRYSRLLGGHFDGLITSEKTIDQRDKNEGGTERKGKSRCWV